MALDSSGPFWTRFGALVYWPLAACVVATPALGFLGSGLGAGRPPARAGWELVALAWIPAAYFTFRAAVMADFYPWPASRCRGSLSLVFARDALALLARPARAVAAALALATPLVLAALCWNRRSLAEWARPLAPIGSLPPGIRRGRGLAEGKRGG